MRYNKDKLMWATAFMVPGIVLFCMFFLVPLVTVIYTSFTQWDGLRGEMTFIGIENYVRIFTTDPIFRTAIKNVATWSALGIFVQVPLAVLLSLFLARKPIGWKFVRSVYMLPIIISQAIIATLFRYIFHAEHGFVTGFMRLFDSSFFYNWFGNANGAFIVVSLTWVPYAAMSVLIIMAELMSIPPELHEAATVDGATSLQIDRHIKLPLITKSIGITVFLTVTGVFKQFTNIFMLTEGGPNNSTVNISLLIYRNITTLRRAGYANAMGTILIVMGVLVMIACNKLFSMDKNLYE